MPEFSTKKFDYSWDDWAEDDPSQNDNDHDSYLDKDQKEERSRIETGILQSVEKLTSDYQRKIEDFLKAHTASLSMAGRANATAAPQATMLRQGKPPMWRGIRGILRWLWYGSHASNPDYADYDMQDHPQQQNDWAIPSLTGYSAMKERLEEAADQITEHLGLDEHIGGGSEELVLQIRQLLQNYKTQLIQSILKPSLLGMWKIGFNHGAIVVSKRNKSGSPNDSPDSNIEPSTVGRPDDVEPAVDAAEKSTDPESQSDTSAISPNTVGQPPKPIDEPSIESPPESTEKPVEKSAKPARKSPTTGVRARVAEKAQKFEFAKDLYADEEFKKQYLDSAPATRTTMLKVVQDIHPVSMENAESDNVLNNSMKKLIELGIDDISKFDDLIKKVQKEISLGEYENAFVDALIVNQAIKNNRRTDLPKIKNRFRGFLPSETIEFNGPRRGGKLQRRNRPIRKTFGPGSDPIDRPENEKEKKAVSDRIEKANAAASNEPDKPDEPKITKAPEADASEDEVQKFIDGYMKGVPSEGFEDARQALMNALSNWTEPDGSFDEKRLEFAFDAIAKHDPNPDTNEAYEYCIGRQWAKLLNAEAQKEYYKDLMREGRNRPYVLRHVVDKMPFEERTAYYNQKLKEQTTP